MWALGHSRVLEEKRVGRDLKVKLPKQEPRQSLFMAVKLALGSLESWLFRNVEHELDYSLRARWQSACKEQSNTPFVLRGCRGRRSCELPLLPEERALDRLCRGAPTRGCRQQKAIGSDTATVQTSQ